ncbi:hypothetical protein ABBQ38_001900 [Trebouxia sp. C0009 RCD-2024]
MLQCRRPVWSGVEADKSGAAGGSYRTCYRSLHVSSVRSNVSMGRCHFLSHPLDQIVDLMYGAVREAMVISAQWVLSWGSKP